MNNTIFFFIIYIYRRKLLKLETLIFVYVFFQTWEFMLFLLKLSVNHLYVGMIMRALNTLPGQDDSEKLATNQKQIEELNAVVDELKNELIEKTNRIEELCRLSNDFRYESERLKTDVRTVLFFFLCVNSLFCSNIIIIIIIHV